MGLNRGIYVVSASGWVGFRPRQKWGGCRGGKIGKNKNKIWIIERAGWGVWVLCWFICSINNGRDKWCSVRDILYPTIIIISVKPKHCGARC